MKIDSTKAQWQQASGLEGAAVTTFAFADSVCFSTVWNKGLFKYSNQNEKWELIDKSFYSEKLMWDTSRKRLYSLIFSFPFLSQSDDYGKTWVNKSAGIPDDVYPVDVIIFKDSLILSSSNGIYKKSQNDDPWELINDKAVDGTLTFVGSDLFFLSVENEVLKSSDSGKIWHKIFFKDEVYLSVIYGSETNLYIGTWYNNGVYKFNPNDSTFTHLDLIGENEGEIVESFAHLNNKIFISTRSEISTYDEIYQGTLALFKSNLSGKLSRTNESIFVAATKSESGVFKIKNDVLTPMNNGFPPKDISVVVRASGDTLIAANYEGEIFRSVDSGLNWESIAFLNTFSTNSALYTQNNSILMGTGDGLNKSTDTGKTWKPLKNGDTQFGARSICELNDSLFAATNSGIYISHNDGDSWEIISSIKTNSIVANGRNVFVGDTHIFYNGWSTNSVINLIPIKTSKVFKVLANNNGVFAATAEGVYILNYSDIWESFNNGLPDDYFDKLIRNIATDDTTLFVSNDNGRFYISSIYSDNWIEISDNNFLMRTSSLALTDKFLVAGGENGIYLYNKVNLVTGISENEDLTINLDFSLKQNYPNPFNPTTEIQYSLNKSEIVSLNVFNSIGALVKTLVNNKAESPGLHTVPFNATGLSSGVYIYRLSSKSGISISKKMILIK